MVFVFVSLLLILSISTEIGLPSPEILSLHKICTSRIATGITIRGQNIRIFRYPDLYANERLTPMVNESIRFYHLTPVHIYT